MNYCDSGHMYDVVCCICIHYTQWIFILSSTNWLFFLYLEEIPNYMNKNHMDREVPFFLRISGVIFYSITEWSIVVRTLLYMADWFFFFFFFPSLHFKRINIKYNPNETHSNVRVCTVYVVCQGSLIALACLNLNAPETLFHIHKIYSDWMCCQVESNHISFFFRSNSQMSGIDYWLLSFKLKCHAKLNGLS